MDATKNVGSRWLIVLVIGAIILFYWFGIRPSNIKKECAGRIDDNGYSMYEECLRQNGL